MKGVNSMRLSSLYQLYRKKHYVYEHYLDGDLIYIGKGQGGRAVEFWARNDEWKRVVNGRYGDVEVKIIKGFEDESEALLFESKLLKLNIDNEDLTNQHFRSYNGSQSQYKKQTKEFILNRIVEVIPEYLDRVLINAERTQMCKEFNLFNKRGEVAMWPTIKKYLIENGFVISKKTKTINGKRCRIVIIHDSHNLIDKSNIKPTIKKKKKKKKSISKLEKLLDEEKTLKSQISDNEKRLEFLLDGINDLIEDTSNLEKRKEIINESIIGELEKQETKHHKKTQKSTADKSQV